MAGRGIAPLPPHEDLVGDGELPLLALLGQPVQRIMRALRLDQFTAPLGQFAAQHGDLVAGGGRISQGGQGRGGLLGGGLGFLAVVLQLLQAVVEPGQARVHGRGAFLQFGQFVAGPGQGGIGGMDGFAGPLLGRGGGQGGGRLGVGLGGGLFGNRLGLADGIADLGEAVALLETGGCCRRGAGGNGEAVPAPQAALAADDALTLGQLCGEALAVGIVLDDADLRQAAGQGGRRLHEPVERHAAAGQGIRLCQGSERAPMDTGGFVCRCRQVLAEGGAEGDLVARFDGDGIDHRRPALVLAGLQDVGQRLGLGLEPGQRRFGLVTPRDGGTRHFVAGGAGLGCLLEVDAGLLGGRGRLLVAGLGGFDLGPADRLFLEGLALALDLGGAAGEILGTPFLILDGAGQAAPPGLLGGDPFGQFGIALIQALDDLAGRFQPGGGFLAGRLLALAGGSDTGRFVLEIAGRRSGVLGQCLFARDVGGDLLQPCLAPPLSLGDPGLFGFQAVAGQGQALQLGRGLGLGLAQRRDSAGPFGLQGRRLGGETGEAGDGGLDLAKVLALGGEVGLGGGPAQMEQGGLGLADVAADVAVAGRLTGLLLEGLVLDLQGAEHVLQAHQVVLGGAQPQLGLVAPRMEAGDAGCFLEQDAALGRLGGDDVADAALADQSVGPRTGRRVGEQQLHVAGPDLLGIDAVGRAAATLDAAADLELFLAVEGRRCGTVGVVEAEDDLGDVARRTVAGAAEDDVVHAAAAHLLGRGFTHHPAQGFHQVRLAAAVRPDDPGQPLFDQEVCRVDEGLEAG